MVVHLTLMRKGRGLREGSFEENGWRRRGIYFLKKKGERMTVVCLE